MHKRTLCLKIKLSHKIDSKMRYLDKHMYIVTFGRSTHITVLNPYY